MICSKYLYCIIMLLSHFPTVAPLSQLPGPDCLASSFPQAKRKICCEHHRKFLLRFTRLKNFKRLGEFLQLKLNLSAILGNLSQHHNTMVLRNLRRGPNWYLITLVNVILLFFNIFFLVMATSANKAISEEIPEYSR